METDGNNSKLITREISGKKKPRDLSFYFVYLFMVNRAVNVETIGLGRQRESIQVIPCSCEDSPQLARDISDFPLRSLPSIKPRPRAVF